MLVCRLANRLWTATGLAATRRFQRALREPRQAQLRCLQRLLERNRTSDYGRRHDFARCRTVQEYQAAVPLIRYEELLTEIERIRHGEPGVLTTEPVLAFERSGGSTAPAKYIPHTRSLKQEFGAAIAPWMADLHGACPGVRHGPAYWSVSPLSAEPEQTPDGIPVGFESDTEYFGPLERLVLARLMATPPELPRIPDLETSRYVTLRFLLAAEQLAFVSVWNPSFLTLLLDAGSAWADRLTEDLERGTLCPPAPLPAGMQCRIRPLPARAAALRRLFHSKNPPWPHVWPGLAVVSCWASAGADRFLPALQERLPGVTIQGKGLLATEGAVTIPLYGLPGAAPALTSHFLEFLSEADPGAPPRLVDELEAGATYQVVLSTGGGLYRYRLEDRVGVVGFHGPTPLLEFLGKVGAVSDLCGEKLHEYYVAQVFGELSRVLGLRPTFTMLAPEWGEPPRYLLLVEGLTPVERDRFADRCELALRQCYHYDYCRRLGQLGPVEAVAVRDAARRYLDRCASLGQRAGDVKPVALHRETGWRDYFRGSAGGP